VRERPLPLSTTQTWMEGLSISTLLHPDYVLGNGGGGGGGGGSSSSGGGEGGAGGGDESKRKKMAIAVLDMSMKMYLRDNFVHSDLHPGNLLYSTGDKDTIIVLDAGLTVTLASDWATPLRQMLRGLTQGNAVSVAEVLLKFNVRASSSPSSSSSSSVDAARLTAQIREVMTTHQSASKRPVTNDGGLGGNDVGTQGATSAINFGAMMGHILMVLQRHGVVLRGDVALTITTMSLVQGLIHQLDPSLDMGKAAGPYLMRYPEGYAEEEERARKVLRQKEEQVAFLQAKLAELQEKKRLELEQDPKRSEMKQEEVKIDAAKEAPKAEAKKEAPKPEEEKEKEEVNIDASKEATKAKAKKEVPKPEEKEEKEVKIDPAAKEAPKAEAKKEAPKEKEVKIDAAKEKSKPKEELEEDQKRLEFKQPIQKSRAAATAVATDGSGGGDSGGGGGGGGGGGSAGDSIAGAITANDTPDSTSGSMSPRKKNKKQTDDIFSSSSAEIDKSLEEQKTKEAQKNLTEMQAKAKAVLEGAIADAKSKLAQSDLSAAVKARANAGDRFKDLQALLKTGGKQESSVWSNGKLVSESQMAEVANLAELANLDKEIKQAQTAEKAKADLEAGEQGTNGAEQTAVAQAGAPASPAAAADADVAAKEQEAPKGRKLQEQDKEMASPPIVVATVASGPAIPAVPSASTSGRPERVQRAGAPKPKAAGTQEVADAGAMMQAKTTPNASQSPQKLEVQSAHESMQERPLLQAKTSPKSPQKNQSAEDSQVPMVLRICATAGCKKPTPSARLSFCNSCYRERQTVPPMVQGETSPKSPYPAAAAVSLAAAAVADKASVSTEIKRGSSSSEIEMKKELHTQGLSPVGKQTQLGQESGGEGGCLCVFVFERERDY